MTPLSRKNYIRQWKLQHSKRFWGRRINFFWQFKTAGFWFWCFVRLEVFSNLVFGCRFLSTMIGFFQIFLSFFAQGRAFDSISGFAEEVTSRMHLR